MSISNLTKSLSSAVSVPWNAFVAAFLYYTLMASVLIGGGRVGAPIVTTAYLAPIVAYAVTIVVRFAQSLATRVPPSLGALPRAAR